MSREGQAILQVLLGTVVLRITVFSHGYLRYVRPALGPYLTATGVLLVLLGLAGAVAAVRARHGEQHHAPRIARLLILPVLAIVLVAPPALGSFTAQRAGTAAARPATADFPPLPAGDPLVLTLAEFDVRARWDPAAPLRGRRVRLTGFALPATGGDWDLARLTISCCAADALTSKAAIRGATAPAQGSWVEVTGWWQPPAGPPQQDATPVLTVDQVRPVAEPDDPYE